MMLTVGNDIFAVTLEQCIDMADVANLRCEIVPYWFETDDMPMLDSASHQTKKYFMWQDGQTGGGGCRLVFLANIVEKFGRTSIPLGTRGIVWVSRHSGYPEADVTELVGDLFVEMGCKQASTMGVRNPNIYGEV